ncbi:glycosyltransferase family 22 protein [Baudoinia panamericana UAMH 10762]|uniref:Mannosyltransferase n=1 Tax=Baudoinia panamericana (strain UAMH 10762) TaxID=717646 RepID=M2N9Y0_BAUPA|nr:glycosyltransferase family 22 protein [Baudoinia panamericana UAMH 10762]EMC95655.1 glycosyltransferase family 22 protein [Baudoinia panamericana UAMH 10762]
MNAFYALFASHIVAAIFSPIQDCDEVFNYWEPTHYLTHGHGFQTWEYSPEYAIRSWAYTGLHALVTLPVKLANGDKVAAFYLLRIFLGFICALSETRLFSKIAATLNPRIAVLFLVIMATSPGMFHASVAYLPSSFAMCFVMLGMAAFMDWRGGLRTAQGIWMFGVGACLGWPFAAALSAPFLIEELYLASISDTQGMLELFWRVVDGVVRTLLCLGLQVSVDGFFYKKLLLVPLNIVTYNIFSSKGPELYGTEPWHFYLRNLFLNFHVWLLLALSAMPLVLAQHFFRTKGATKSSWLRGVVFLTPFYIWLAIFTLQPHKEERFMYPAYPALALNAAVAMHIILANLGSTDQSDLIAKIPVMLRLAGILGFIVLALSVSVLRIMGHISAYDAPLSVYHPLKANATNPGDTVCLGKEWYRFPSHYHLPEGVKAKFIRSEFSGLLPGEFSEVASGQSFGLFPGTWLVPPGMNDENREDLSKYTDVKHCNFLVDSHSPSTEVTGLEPSYISDNATWEKVHCVPYLDAASTNIVGRLFWIPNATWVPEQYQRVWGEYCLLKRRPQKKPVASTPAGAERTRRYDIPSIETLG